jgi:predicted type IV restriction endonuclease
LKNMGIDKIKAAVEGISKRASIAEGKGEEATKQALVLPLIESLGWDIWNPEEVQPEFEADTTVKKGGQKEKVDYALLVGSLPRIFIEVKSIDENLDGHQGQLKRYFNSHPSVSLGILTNGMEYRFFSDTHEQNIQDDEPFYISKFDSVDQGLDVLARFQKDVFSPEAIRDFATELTHKANIIEFLNGLIDVRNSELSEEFVRWILKEGKICSTVVTAKVVDKFEPIIKDALQHVIKRIVRRSIAAMELGVSISESDESKEKIDPIELLETEIDTTESLEEETEVGDVEQKKARMEEELKCFAIIKELFDNSEFVNQKIYNPSTREREELSLSYRETQNYFNIYFNKPSWWNLRIYLSPRTCWLGIDVEKEVAEQTIPNEFERLNPTALAEVRVKIENHEDIRKLSNVILASFSKTVQDREKFTIGEEAAN